MRKKKDSHRASEGCWIQLSQHTTESRSDGWLKLTAPPPSSSSFYAECLSATTLPIYPGWGQAPNNVGLHIQWLGFSKACNR